MSLVQGGAQQQGAQVGAAILAAAAPYYQPAVSQDIVPDRPIGYGAFGVVWWVYKLNAWPALYFTWFLALFFCFCFILVVVRITCKTHSTHTFLVVVWLQMKSKMLLMARFHMQTHIFTQIFFMEQMLIKVCVFSFHFVIELYQTRHSNRNSR